MIPVYDDIAGHKPRLPRTMSWSIGTERLSERFADVPQIEELRIWYCDRPMGDHGFPLAKMKAEEIIRRALPYEVFTVWYSTTGVPHWFFMVYPVAGDRKHDIRTLLEAAAFPAVEAWLRGKKTETWLMQSHHLRCVYHPAEQQIETSEDSCT